MSADTTPAAVAERVAAWREMARMTLALDDHPLNDLPRATAAKLANACDLITALTAERDAAVARTVRAEFAAAKYARAATLATPPAADGASS